MSDQEEDELVVPAHPRFRQRRAEVADQSQRSRKRKLIALAVIVGAVLLAAASTQTPLFDVDEVRVVGADVLNPDDLRDIAAVELGVPILGLDTDAIAQRMIALPTIADSAVSKSWTGRVTVEVRERTPVARIESLDGVIVIAADGIVTELFRQEVAEDGTVEPADLPVRIEDLIEIGGAMFSTRPGRPVPDVLRDAVMLAGEMPADIAQITDRIEITVDSLVLRVTGGGDISVGDSRNLNEKFEAIRAFLQQVDLSCLDILNVRAPSVPTVVRNEGC